MNQLAAKEYFGKAFFQILWLNLAVGMVMAFIFWVAQNKAGQQTFFEEAAASLIHSIIYGLTFGLTMPYLGERLGLLNFPWNWITIFISLLIIAFTAILLVEFTLLGFGYLSLKDFRVEYIFKSLSVFLIALLIAIGIYVYESFRDRIQATNLQLRTQELEKERALKLATEARLSSLESKLHPHFLFNTLNSISALILEDPLLADQMVQRLSMLLRTSLDAFEKNNLTLEEEINLVTNYLEIEKVRFRERLNYEIKTETAVKSIIVPPLILQPMVENSVKFAIAPNPAGGLIKISVWCENGNLILEVWDNGPGFTTEVIPNGHGLDNLQARLAVMFRHMAKLTVDSQKNGTAVKVLLPLNACQSTK